MSHMVWISVSCCFGRLPPSGLDKKRPCLMWHVDLSQASPLGVNKVEHWYLPSFNFPWSPFAFSLNWQQLLLVCFALLQLRTSFKMFVLQWRKKCYWSQTVTFSLIKQQQLICYILICLLFRGVTWMCFANMWGEVRAHEECMFLSN